MFDFHVISVTDEHTLFMDPHRNTSYAGRSFTIKKFTFVWVVTYFFDNIRSHLYRNIQHIPYRVPLLKCLEYEIHIKCMIFCLY